MSEEAAQRTAGRRDRAVRRSTKRARSKCRPALDGCDAIIAYDIVVDQFLCGL